MDQLEATFPTTSVATPSYLMMYPASHQHAPSNLVASQATSWRAESINRSSRPSTSTACARYRIHRRHLPSFHLQKGSMHWLCQGQVVNHMTFRNRHRNTDIPIDRTTSAFRFLLLRWVVSVGESGLGGYVWPMNKHWKVSAVAIMPCSQCTYYSS